jgi:hypothetical protein
VVVGYHQVRHQVRRLDHRFFAPPLSTLRSYPVDRLLSGLCPRQRSVATSPS